MKILALLFCFLLCSCGRKFKEGYVSSKEFHPAHTEESVSYISVNNTLIPIFDNDYYPNKWYLIISNDSYQGSYENVEVTEKRFNEVSIGQIIKFE